jgi:hypothetical protein
MKRDLTLTGHRTAGGMLRDGMTAMQRYYLALARDAERQAGFDMLTRGGYKGAKDAALAVLGLTRGEGLLQEVKAPAAKAAAAGRNGGGTEEGGRSALQSPAAAAGSRPASGVGAVVTVGSKAATAAPALPKKPLPPLPQVPQPDSPATPDAPRPPFRLQPSTPNSQPLALSQSPPSSREGRVDERGDAAASYYKVGAGSDGKRDLSLEKAEEMEAALRTAADRAMTTADELTQEVAAKLDEPTRAAGD